MNSTNQTNSTWSLNDIISFHYLPYTIMNSVGIIGGVFGNLLIMSAILLTKQLQNTANILVFNLSLAHFLVSSFVDSSALIGILFGEDFFNEHPFFCQIAAMGCVLICGTSYLNMAAIAINRYTYVKHSGYYKIIFSKNKSILFCLMFWILAFLLNFPFISKHTGSYFDKRLMVCVMAKQVNKQAYLSLISALMIMSALVLTVMYFLVYRTIIKSLNLRLKQNRDHFIEQQNLLKETHRFHPRHRYNRELAINLHTEESYKQELAKYRVSVRHSKGLLIISFIFFLTCIPLSSVQIIDEFYTLPSFLYLYSFLFTRLCSLFNPLFYGLYCSKFLFDYENVLNVIIHRQRLNFKKYEEEKKVKKAVKKKKNVFWRKKDDLIDIK